MANFNIKTKCHICDKQVLVTNEFVLDAIKMRYITYECGHTLKSEYTESTVDEVMKISSLPVHGEIHHPFKYQAETVQFIEKAGLRGIINHEMGVGKMVCECLVLARNWEEMTPCLIISPAGLTYQWFQHLARWNKTVAQILTTKNPWPNFDFYKVFIVSVDSLWRLPWAMTISHNDKIDGTYAERKEQAEKPEFKLIVDKFKHICIDEVQKIKNPTAQRTQAVKKLSKAKKVITLSGTTVENNAKEYFTALHVVRPDVFPTEAGYIQRFVRTDYYGKYLGMRNRERFHELTQDWIIRYKRDDVLPDLPKIWRKFQSGIIEEKGLQDAYEAEMQAFEDYMTDHALSAASMTSILGYFAKMRHIVGLSKVNPAVEFIEEHLLETNRKLVVFYRHKDVGQFIKLRIDKTLRDGGFAESVTITSDLDAKERMQVIEQFRAPECRILLGSIEAMSEGLNLQFCSDALITERLWKPEVQAEARFTRPGSEAERVNVNYLITAGTIDEMLTELIEKKRNYAAQTLDNEDLDVPSAPLLKELTELMSAKGMSKWRASIM